MNAEQTEEFLKRHPEYNDDVELGDYHELERQDFERERELDAE
jgi:trehalose-6-phosphate synthase